LRIQASCIPTLDISRRLLSLAALEQKCSVQAQQNRDTANRVSPAWERPGASLSGPRQRHSKRLLNRDITSAMSVVSVYREADYRKTRVQRRS
jgi:hypothetical protein